MTLLRAVRKEMGILFWTIPWYSRSDISFRMTENRCACSLILGTSWRDGSVSYILRKIMFRFISWIVTRMLYRTSLSDILSKMAGWGLLYIISLGVSSSKHMIITLSACNTCHMHSACTFHKCHKHAACAPHAGRMHAAHTPIHMSYTHIHPAHTKHAIHMSQTCLMYAAHALHTCHSLAICRLKTFQMHTFMHAQA